MCKFLLFILALALVAGCSTTNPQVTGDKSAQDRLGNAMVSPLSDLNIVQVAIPPVIQDALKDPYQLPSALSCPTLIEKIHHLDVVLGLDLDAPAPVNEKSTSEKSQQFVRDEAIGSFERTISGFVPFRGWLRRLSGAERRSRDLANAITAGFVRRAFLKGMGQQLGCEPPGSPIKHPADSATIVPVTVEAKNSNEIIVAPKLDSTARAAPNSASK